MKELLNEWRKYTTKVLNEEADPTKLDPTKFPLPLSKVNPKTSKTYTRSGNPRLDKSGGDDVINLQKGEYPVAQLKPSQSSMNIGKALGMVISMLDPTNKFSAGGDLGAFISNDKFIMDGHHRWIASAMIDPSLKMGGMVVDFPAQQLVPVLNAITKGLLGIMKASGGFNQFQPGPLKKQLEAYAQKGNLQTDKETGEVSGQKPEEVMAILQKFTGVKGPAAIEAAANKMSKNLSALTMQAPSWAPGRPDMPVIDPDIKPGAIEIAVKALKSGQIDVNPPYGTGASAASPDQAAKHGQKPAQAAAAQAPQA